MGETTVRSIYRSMEEELIEPNVPHNLICIKETIVTYIINYKKFVITKTIMLIRVVENYVIGEFCW